MQGQGHGHDSICSQRKRLADEFVGRTPNRHGHGMREGEYWKRKYEEECHLAQRNHGGSSCDSVHFNRRRGGDGRSSQSTRTNIEEVGEDDDNESGSDNGSVRSMDANNRRVPDFVVRER